MKLLKAFALVLVLAVAGLPSAARAQSVAGEWDATMNTPGGPRPFKILFKADSTKLTGTVKRANGDVPLEGTQKGKDVKFSYTIEYNGNALTLTVTATVNGDAMKGSISFNGQAEEEFAATRVVARKP